VAVLSHHDPDPGTRNGGSGQEDVQVGRPPPLPPSEDRTDLFAEPDTAGRREPTSLGRALIRAHALLRSDSHGEACATPPASPVQGLASAPRLHTGPEPVLVAPLPVAWPVCRLHLTIVRRWEPSESRAGKAKRGAARGSTLPAFEPSAGRPEEPEKAD
jgi:hypothetical protein